MNLLAPDSNHVIELGVDPSAQLSLEMTTALTHNLTATSQETLTQRHWAELHLDPMK